MGLFFLLAVALSILAAALPATAWADPVPGHYTDYVYSQDYRAPERPADLPLNCTFFHPDDNTCSVLADIPPSAQNATTRALIARATPEENQDWVRFWNSRLPLGAYYDNASDTYAFNQSDGAGGENGSLRNVWMRLVDFYPSVLDEKDNAYYLPSQALMYAPVSLQFVVPNPADAGDYCAQDYRIDGYDFELTKRVGDYSTMGVILPVQALLRPGEAANLTMRLSAVGAYARNFSKWANLTACDGNGCNYSTVCKLDHSDAKTDTLALERNVSIKAYPSQTSYENSLAVPKSGFAQGLMRVHLPSDFLYYTLMVKGQSFTVRRNELQVHQRGDTYPVLDLHLVPAPGRAGTLQILGLNESGDGVYYDAEIRYRLLVAAPDIGQADCQFAWASPFQTYVTPNACEPARTIPTLRLLVPNDTGATRRVIAKVEDQLGNPLPGLDVEFTGLSINVFTRTDQTGQAFILVPVRESTQTVVAQLVGSPDVAGASATAFMPGRGAAGGAAGAGTASLLAAGAPIVLIIAILSALMVWLGRKRSAWLLLSMLLLLGALAIPLRAQSSNQSSSGPDVQSTLDACKNYDFNNAVRHFGECASAYQISTDFNALRSTAGLLAANIAPLVVANPDVAPYKPAYANMVLIALALFRVAWAFNSLYLILNIFNPIKRSEALKQYGWLIVFVFFVYGSFILLQDTIGVVNTISAQVAGPDAASTLQQATLSVSFVVENYEMLKMVLPLLHLTYLILLARYITVIGMILFFPFTLLLFFTSATRGFGRAALTVTAASLGLGVLNAILLLIYNILVKTADPTLTGTFASTFFSASFIVFFGFVNVLVLAVAFLSGIFFIGQNRSEG